MALEPSQLELQIQNFSRLIKDKLPNIEQHAKAPGSLLSLSTQIKALQTFEKRHEYQIEAPTSGESSPCISDTERDIRSQMPTMPEIGDLLTEELSLEVDTNIEKLRGFREKSIVLLFEDFDQSFRRGKVQACLKDLRVNEIRYDRIVTERETRGICFKGTNSFLVTFDVRKPDLLYDFARVFLNRIREETRRPIRISIVVDDKREKEEWHGVTIRNLPPKVTSKDVLTQCQREVSGQIEVGTVIKLKERYCCIVRCDYLEDAEFICRRLNGFQLKDPQTYEKYVVKAYIHPQSSYRHFSTEKSLFRDIIQKKERPPREQRPSKFNKTGINELLDIFVKSKKPAPPTKSKPTEPTKRKESIEEKIAPPTSDMDSILKRICSTQPSNLEDKPQEQGPESGELTQASGLTKLIQSASIEVTTADNGLPEREANLRQDNNQDEENRSDDKYQEPEEGDILPPDAPPDDLLEKPDYSSKPESVKREFTSHKYGDREVESGSRHVRRSSSKGSYYRKPGFQRFDREDNNYHKRPFQYNSTYKYGERKKYERDDRKKYHRDDRDKKRNRSSHRSSKSRSRSRSKSKSVGRSHKYKQYGNNNDTAYKRSHRRSNSSKGSRRKSHSQNRRKHSKKPESNSKSVSKSKSRSSRRDRDRDRDRDRERGKNSKDHKKSETTTFFEYNGKNSEDIRSSSSGRKARRERKSRSTSKDRNKKRSFDQSHTKHYRNHSRERSGRPHHDYYNKTTYQKKDYRDRRDYHDSRNRNYHESSDRRSTYHQRNKRDYDDHRKKKDYDNGKGKHYGRDRSPSGVSKSVDKSRSRSSESLYNKEKRRNGSNERNLQRSPSGDNRAELRIESKLTVVAPETSNDHPKEKI